jgi:DNA-binding response OmpR family regulator
MAHRILVVEDDNATRVGLSAALADAGYEVSAVSSLGTALQALTDERPDLLLAGMELEGGTGLQLVAVNPRPIPAIVLSSFSDPVLDVEARQLGASYMVKPVSPGALLRVVRQKLAGDAAAGFTATRRWERKTVNDGWRVRVEDLPARVLDVSYGGVRLEMERAPGAWLPLSFRLQMPTASLPVDVDVVWKRRNGDSTWLCGAQVHEENRASWREVVDSLADAVDV